MCKYEEALSEFRKDEITEDGYETIKEALQDKINPWKPIESAPKTGRILLSFPCYKHAQIGWYNEPSGEFEIVEAFKNKKEPYIAPIHWMPIPTPPSKDKEQMKTMYKWLWDFLNSNEPIGMIVTKNPLKDCMFMFKRYKTMGAQLVDGNTLVINKKTIMFNETGQEEITTIKVM